MSGLELAKNLRAINRDYDLAAGIHFDIRKAAEYLEAAPDLAKEVERLREALELIAWPTRSIVTAHEIARKALNPTKER